MIVLMFFCIVVFKLISTCKSIFKVDIKTLILPQLTSLWCLYYNTGRRFYLLYVLEESEVVPCKGSIKNLFLKIPQNSQENICAKVSNKAAGWSSATIKYRIWFRCFPVNCAKSLRTSILQTPKGPAFER